MGSGRLDSLHGRDPELQPESERLHRLQRLSRGRLGNRAPGCSRLLPFREGAYVPELRPRLSLRRGIPLRVFGERLHSDLPVEDVRIEVCPVRPGYGAQLRIDADLGEVGGVAQRLEDSTEAEMGREIDHAFNT